MHDLVSMNCSEFPNSSGKSSYKEFPNNSNSLRAFMLKPL